MLRFVFLRMKFVNCTIEFGQLEAKIDTFERLTGLSVVGVEYAPLNLKSRFANDWGDAFKWSAKANPTKSKAMLFSSEFPAYVCFRRCVIIIRLSGSTWARNWIALAERSVFFMSRIMVRPPKLFCL